MSEILGGSTNRSQDYQLRHIDLTGVAGNANSDISPDTYGDSLTWEIGYGRLELNCDDDVGNRYIIGELYSGGDEKFLGPLFQSPVITADQTRDLMIVQNWISPNSVSAGDYLVAVGKILLKDDFYLRVKVSGGFADDAVSIQMIMYEW